MDSEIIKGRLTKDFKFNAHRIGTGNTALAANADLRDIFAQLIEQDGQRLSAARDLELPLDQKIGPVTQVIMPPTSAFITQLKTTLGDDNDTIQKVLFTLKQLQIPIPEHEDDFVKSTEGALMLTNKYGMAIRIEQKIPSSGLYNIQRFNDVPFILQPLASFEAGDAIVELCPGLYGSNDEEEVRTVDRMLDDANINFFDSEDLNRATAFFGQAPKNTGKIGVLPFKTLSFPNGVPVVIDRLGVEKPFGAVGEITDMLKAIGVDKDPQAVLYSPLRKALKAAWLPGQATAQPEKIAAFWALCAQFVTEGKLLAGWNDDRDMKWKLEPARTSAIRMDQKFQAATPIAVDDIQNQQTAAIWRHFMN